MSGNPGGRPKLVSDVRAAARQHTADAIKMLAAIMGDGKAPAAARIAAARELLDRAWGKAPGALTIAPEPPDEDRSAPGAFDREIELANEEARRVMDYTGDHRTG
jgi:hypothetical protein